MRNGSARLALFVLAAAVLAGAFAAVVRAYGVRSPVGIVALLTIEVAAIALAVAFHVVELPRNAPRTRAGPERAYAEADYF